MDIIGRPLSPFCARLVANTNHFSTLDPNHHFTFGFLLRDHILSLLHKHLPHIPQNERPFLFPFRLSQHLHCGLLAHFLLGHSHDLPLLELRHAVNKHLQRVCAEIKRVSVPDHHISVVIRSKRADAMTQAHGTRGNGAHSRKGLLGGQAIVGRLGSLEDEVLLEEGEGKVLTSSWFESA